MPFMSKAQRGYMYAKHPELAKEFEKKTIALKKNRDEKKAKDKKKDEGRKRQYA